MIEGEGVALVLGLDDAGEDAAVAGGDDLGLESLGDLLVGGDDRLQQVFAGLLAADAGQVGSDLAALDRGPCGSGGRRPRPSRGRAAGRGRRRRRQGLRGSRGPGRPRVVATRTRPASATSSEATTRPRLRAGRGGPRGPRRPRGGGRASGQAMRRPRGLSRRRGSRTPPASRRSSRLRARSARTAMARAGSSRARMPEGRGAEAGLRVGECLIDDRGEAIVAEPFQGAERGDAGLGGAVAHRRPGRPSVRPRASMESGRRPRPPRGGPTRGRPSGAGRGPRRAPRRRGPRAVRASGRQRPVTRSRPGGFAHWARVSSASTRIGSGISGLPARSASRNAEAASPTRTFAFTTRRSKGRGDAGPTFRAASRASRRRSARRRWPGRPRGRAGARGRRGTGRSRASRAVARPAGR